MSAEAEALPTKCVKCGTELVGGMMLCEEVDGGYCGPCWDGGVGEACEEAHGEGCATMVFTADYEGPLP